MKATFRFSFVFHMKDLNVYKRKAIETYILGYHQTLVDLEKDGADCLIDLYCYETSCKINEAGDEVVNKVLAVVFIGYDWLNFMNDVLDFNEAFPKKRFPRVQPYAFVLKDESGLWDDRQIFLQINNWHYLTINNGLPSTLQ